MTSTARREAAVWQWFGRQLAQPSGPGGRLVGRLMALVNRAPYERTLAALGPCSGQTILEIGYGPGAGVSLLLRRGARVCGLDMAPAMRDAATRRNAIDVANGRADLRVGAADRIPWPDGSFDQVLAVNVAYFLGPEAIRDIRRVLAPHGRLVLYATADATMKHWPFAGPQTHRTFDAEGLRTLLGQGGFPQSAITVQEERLPLGVQGLIATARQA